MGFFDLVEKRHSVRSFQEKAVEEKKLQQILNAASKAPSAGDLKAYEITVVKDLKQRQELATAAFGQGFVAAAPLVLVFSAVAAKSAAKYGQRGSMYALQDATIACAFAILAAAQLGLGSTWVGAFDEQEITKVMGLKEGLRPIALLPVGYAKE